MASKLVVINDYNLRPDLCAPCGGVCCKNSAGITRPEQWGSTREERITRLRSAFLSGNYVADYWDLDLEEIDGIQGGGATKIYLVRPAHTDEVHVFPDSYRGRCIFFGKDGCGLQPSERPHNCAVVVPGGIGHNCLAIVDGVQIGRLYYAKAWHPHQDEVLEAALPVRP